MYFILGCAGSSLLCGLFSWGEQGLLSGCSAQVSHCGGLCCRGALALGSQASEVVALGLWNTAQ